ncbi:MAG: family 20 glycosylhydrolase [candidate division WS1 bacterium]|jgi:hypothetical protein|nr:family 20 glycosylhydrolase [candidate division WS1 bacterium]
MARNDLRPATTDAAKRFPCIIPEPQHVELYAGNVARPAQRETPLGSDPSVEAFADWIAEALRGMDYEVKVAIKAEFAPAEVPEEALDEAYELSIGSAGAELTARAEDGVRWGLRTLGEVLSRIPDGGAIPPAKIVDWPMLRTRGVFVEDKWGPDLMELDDWKDVVDYLAERKLNNLGIGLYGCWCVQYDGTITEWINVPVPGHPELKREWTIRWYSPTEHAEKEITYLPPIFAQDFFGEIVAYGRQRGVEVIPYVNSLGHNTLIPRLIPEFAAKTETGEPEEFGYCLSNPDVVEFVKSWYGHMYETYLKPNGVHTFHIQLDEVGTKFCRCAKCSEIPKEKQFQDWAMTLAKHLVSLGVQNVVIYNDQFTRHMAAWDEAFVERLRAEGLIDHVIIDWWWYSNESINPQADPKMGYGVRSWVKPMSCYYNWSRWDPRQRNTEKMLQRAHTERAEGAASYSVFDPAWGLEFDALAEYAWNNRGAGPVHLFEEKWAAVRGDGDLLEARRLLDRAAQTAGFGPIWYYAYTYQRPGKPWPREYPLEALEAVCNLQEDLLMLQEVGRRARMLLEGRGDDLSRNMACEAARIECHGHAFYAMSQVFNVANGRAAEQYDARGLAREVDCARASVVDAMALMERNKPHYLVPSYLRDMSVLWEFLGFLSEQLADVAGGSRDWSQIEWFIENEIAQRGRK